MSLTTSVSSTLFLMTAASGSTSVSPHRAPSAISVVVLMISGPLLWHFENAPTNSAKGEGSIELSLDEVKDLARIVGFEIHVS